MLGKETFGRCALIGLWLMWAESALGYTEVIFVDHQATGGNNGTTWQDAYTDLQVALGAVPPSPPHTYQIWVASGTYKPDTDTGLDREKSFVLRDSVELYGGFARGEDPAFDENDDPTFDFSSRDFVLNETILSGDMPDNDSVSCPNGDEDCNTLPGACRGDPPFCTGDNSS